MLTASATCPCFPWSAIPRPPTPTCASGAWRGRTGGPSSPSPERRGHVSPLLRHRALPGTVIIDTDSAPRLVHFGEAFREERLPVGTRVLYPPPPIAGLRDPRRAIRDAIDHPLGCDPFPALLRAGMRVTIAMDDISLPLPPMVTPDVRQMALEVLLPILAEKGVEDVHLVIANS